MNYKNDLLLIKALADENRLAVLDLLKTGEKCACVLLEKLNISQSTLSHHMKILCDSGVVNSRKQGKWRHYSLSSNLGVFLTKLTERYTTKIEFVSESTDISLL